MGQSMHYAEPAAPPCAFDVSRASLGPDPFWDCPDKRVQGLSLSKHTQYICTHSVLCTQAHYSCTNSYYLCIHIRLVILQRTWEISTVPYYHTIQLRLRKVLSKYGGKPYIYSHTVVATALGSVPGTPHVTPPGRAHGHKLEGFKVPSSKGLYTEIS